MDVWVNLLTNFGLATMILLALGFGAWRVLGWVGVEIVLPARDRLFSRIAASFDRIDAATTQISNTLGAMQQSLLLQSATLAKMATAAEANARTATAGARVVEKISEKIDKANGG